VLGIQPKSHSKKRFWEQRNTKSLHQFPGIVLAAYRAGRAKLRVVCSLARFKTLSDRTQSLPALAVNAYKWTRDDRLLSGPVKPNA